MWLVAVPKEMESNPLSPHLWASHRNLTDTAEQNTTLGHPTIEKPLQHPPRSPGCALRAQPTGSEARTTWKAHASPRATALPARPAGPLLTARRNRRQGSQPSILVKASGGQGLGWQLGEITDQSPRKAHAAANNQLQDRNSGKFQPLSFSDGCQQRAPKCTRWCVQRTLVHFTMCNFDPSERW